VQPLGLLCAIAEPQDDLGNERVAHGEDHGDRGARPRDGFDAEGVADVIVPQASVLARDRDPEQAARGGLPDERHRECV
jgi:hypothetical protein